MKLGIVGDSEYIWIWWKLIFGLFGGATKDMIDRILSLLLYVLVINDGSLWIDELLCARMMMIDDLLCVWLILSSYGKKLCL